MHEAPDHPGTLATSESALDRWNTLWEPAARRYQPVVDHSTPPALFAAPSSSSEPTVQL
ncbi:hypothetical protein M1D51_02175 [Arthrobacter sp. R3-55]